MRFDFDAGSLQLREPQVAQRCLLGHDEVLAVLESAAAAGDDGGAVGEVMDGVDVAAQGQRGVVVEAGAVGLFGGFELVDEAGKELGLGAVAHLGDFAAGAVGVMAHVVGGDGGAEAADEGVEGLAVGEDAGGIDLHGGDDEVVHDFDFFVAFE